MRNYSYFIKIRGVEFQVCFNYSPGIAERRFYSNGDVGHEAEPEELEITSIFHNNTDFTEFFQDSDFEDVLTALEEFRQ